MVRAILYVALVALSFSACGGDATTTTPAPTETPTSTTAADPAGDVVPIEAEPCALLTADDVGHATGLISAEGYEDGAITCVFDVGTDSGVSVFVAVEDGQGRFSGPASLYAAYSDEGDEVIDGVGESAIYSSALRTIAVNGGGGRFIAVGVNGGYAELDEPRDVLVELATVALGHL
jgi:hypothetical protein